MTERCIVTGNPVGTDTWEVNNPCRCGPCQKFVALRGLAAATSDAATRAACRAALLATCKSFNGNVTWWVAVDDAAACLAEREARLRMALLNVSVHAAHLPDAPRGLALDLLDRCGEIARAALAAAQEVDDGK